MKNEITKESLIEDLQKFYKENGRIPKYKDFKNKNGEYCGVATYINNFGSWNNALKIAGFITYKEIRDKCKLVNYCKNCGEEIITTFKKNKTFCCKSCAALFNNKIRPQTSRDKQRNTLLATLKSPPLHKTTYSVYRKLCEFRIPPSKYEIIPNYDLYLKYGFYNPKSKKTGVCLDHIFSIRDGYELKINPLIISHPVNCQFLMNTDNSRKGKQSDITLQELIKRVSLYDKTNIVDEAIMNDYNKLKSIYEYYDYTPIQYSSITGKIYHTELKPALGWNNPNKVSARVLAKAFNFELGDVCTTEKNILNAIEILKHHYFIEKMNPQEIKRLYNIEYSSFGAFLNNIFK